MRIVGRSLIRVNIRCFMNEEEVDERDDSKVEIKELNKFLDETSLQFK